MPTIKSENWDGVTAPAIPTGWTVDSFYLQTATTNSPTSAPNSLIYLLAHVDAAVVPHATWASLDTNSGNVQVSATVRFANAAAAGEQDVWVFARSPVVAAAGTWGTHSYYSAGISRNAAESGLNLSKSVGGTSTTLGLVGASAFADATNYRVFLACQDSTLQAKCQRLSDSFWLNSSGSFVSDPTNSTVAISVTDTSLSAAAGYSGVAFYLGNASGGAVGVDDWLLETNSVPLISASPSRLQAGSGAQAVTVSGVGTNFSTTSSTQFTLSGGSGASIVSQSASSATAAALSINPGTASGPLTITDTTDGSIVTTIAVQATYYVSAAGSDTNTGIDTAHPWQTIAHVNAQTLYPGDQVLFEGSGVFAGNLVIQNSGSAAHPILLGSYGSGQATINPGTGTGIQVKDCDWVRVSSLSVSGPGVTLVGSTSSTTSTGMGVEVVSTQTQSSIASWRQSVYLSGLAVSGCLIGIECHTTAGSSSGPYPVGYNDVRITGCTAHDCLGVGIRLTSGDTSPYFGIENGPSNTPYHKNVYIADGVVYNILGDSSFHSNHSGNGILVSNVDTGITERCLVHDCGQAQGSTTGDGPVANWCYAAKNYTIQHCESHHMHDGKGFDADGFDIDGGSQNCIVQYCYSHDNDGSGFIWGTYPSSAATTNNTFRYNVSANNGRLVNADAMHSFGNPVGTQIYNNTFYSGSPAGASVLLNTLTEGSFYNNIFWCGSGVGLMSNATGVTLAGNLYWFGGGGFSVVYGGTTYTSLAAFQAVQESASGVASGLFADPALAAPGTGGTLLPASPVAALAAYDLGAGSMAIDAGLDLRTLFGIDPGPIDLRGGPNRAGAGYDIGATEYGSAALLGAGGGGGVRRVSLSGGIGG